MGDLYISFKKILLELLLKTGQFGKRFTPKSLHFDEFFFFRCKQRPTSSSILNWYRLEDESSVPRIYLDIFKDERQPKTWTSITSSENLTGIHTEMLSDEINYVIHPVSSPTNFFWLIRCWIGITFIQVPFSYSNRDIDWDDRKQRRLLEAFWQKIK